MRNLKTKKNKANDVMRNNNADFCRLVNESKLFERELLALFEVDKRTLNSWIKTGSAPAMACKLLKMVKANYIPSDKDWNGFYFEDNTLRTPAGQRLNSGDILAWFYDSQRLDSLSNECERLKAINAKLKKLVSPKNDSIFDENGKLKQYKLL